MGDMRAKGRGEHVIQPFADGANGWLVGDVSPSWLFRGVRMNVPHHGGDYGVTMQVNVLHHGVAMGSGRGAQVVAIGGLDLPGSCGPSLARIEFDNWDFFITLSFR